MKPEQWTATLSEMREWMVDGLTNEIVATEHKDLFTEAAARAEGIVRALPADTVKRVCTGKIMSFITYGETPTTLLEILREGGIHV